MFDKRYWIWLSLAFDVANAVSDKLVFDFGGDPEAIYHASYIELKSSIGENTLALRSLLDKDLHRAERILDYCEVNNIGILTQDSRRYPPSLLSIRGKPLVLYYRGSLPDLSDKLAVAVVGTRRVSDYGSNAAYSISYDLAKRGVIVVSGMASGTDGVAHHGALDALGSTIAVLGSGIDVIYPRSNSDLYGELAIHGTIITEYPPHSRPEGWHFPQRNRIISGLSSGILVVEAAEKSGSLITAEHAKKQGRLIYAIPGKVGELTSLGTNNLIRNGAKIVTCAEDILKDFGALYKFNSAMAFERKHLRSPKLSSELLVSEPMLSVPLVQQRDASEEADGYMSMAVDKKLEAARRAMREHEELESSSELEYPEGDLSRFGYRSKGFWESSEQERSIGARRVPQIHATAHAAEYAPDVSASRARHTSKKRIPSDLSEDDRRILEFINSHRRATADELTSIGLSVHTVTARLTVMEIRGLVECTDGGYYSLT